MIAIITTDEKKYASYISNLTPELAEKCFHASCEDSMICRDLTGMITLDELVPLHLLEVCFKLIQSRHGSDLRSHTQPYPDDYVCVNENIYSGDDEAEW